MKEAVTKVIDMRTQEDFHGAFEKLLERYNKCIAVGGDYFEGDMNFMCVLSIKVPITKKGLETYLMILVYGNIGSRHNQTRRDEKKKKPKKKRKRLPKKNKKMYRNQAL